MKTFFQILLFCFTFYYVISSETIDEQNLLPESNGNKPSSNIQINYVPVIEKLTHYVTKVTPQQPKKTFVSYFIGNVPTEKAVYKIVANNLMLFDAVIRLEANTTVHPTTFYVFQVVHGLNNPLAQYLTTKQLPNVEIIEWPHTILDSFAHFHLTSTLKTSLLAEFPMVYFMNNFARGPLAYSQNSQWIQEINSMVLTNKLSVLSAVVTCDGMNRKQLSNHFFALPNHILPIFANETMKIARSKRFLPRFVQRIEDLGLIHHGIYQLKINSDVTQENYCEAKAYYDGIGSNHSVNYCAIQFPKIFFYKHSRETSFQIEHGCVTKRYDLLQQLIETHSMILHQLQPALTLKSLPFFIPETKRPSINADIYAEYEWEMMQTYLKAHKHPHIENRRDVCFLVRTSSMHDVQPSQQRTHYNREVEMGLQELIQSLIRQSDSHWQAFFIITDDAPFESRLQELLYLHHDPRLQYYHVPREFRKKYEKQDAGYAITDLVLADLLKKEGCNYISATNGDNIYGSEVVERVRNAKQAPFAEETPDMVITPLNSRNFIDTVYHYSKQLNDWSSRCWAFDSSVTITYTHSTALSRPKLERIDLASVFFNREKLLHEKVFFNNFTDPVQYPCIGCQDGYLTEYLVTHRRWQYSVLPMETLKSIVFHGPSPLWCVAAGNIWFDHPEVGKVRCYAPATVDELRKIDMSKGTDTLFDWHYFYSTPQVCLRLSQRGFTSYKDENVFSIFQTM